MAATGGQKSMTQGNARLLAEAERFLQTVGDSANISQLLEGLGGDAAGLDPSLRQQLDELARLATVTGDPGGELKAVQKDADFEVLPSDDGMLLLLSARPAVAGGKPLAAEAIIAWLKQKDVQRGVNPQAIREAVEAVSQGKDVRGVPIVSGRVSEPGTPGRVEYYGRSSPGGEPALLDHAVMWKPDFPWLCQAGDCIARCIPPVAGKAGYDAWNKPLEPPASKPASLAVGSNVREENGAYCAELGGMVSLRQGQLEVRRILVLVNDVTPQDGPVTFSGEVHVRAAVRSGSTIQAQGDIIVDGAVEDVTIESTEGNVILRHGVAGRHRGLIKAKGDVETGFAENAIIQAGQDILVKVGALHCNLSAGRAIILNHARGQLLGGVAVAGSYIEAKRIGAAAGIPTELIVGLSQEDMLKLSELDVQVAGLSQWRDDSTELADRIKRVVGDPLKLPPSELDRYKELRRVQLGVELKLRLLTGARNQILSASAKAHGGEVRILRTAMPNVIIHIGETTMRLKEQTDCCVLVYDSKRDKIVAK